jgi:hypothetical protein
MYLESEVSWNAGVLVLSEFAGAAQSLGAGAILVNPWNITDMAAAIEDALTMSDQVSSSSCFACHCGPGISVTGQYVMTVLFLALLFMYYMW